MLEIVGNIWDCYDQGYTICVTTNGFVKKNGCATMGRGTALQAKRRFNGIDRKLGDMLGGPTGITNPARWMFIEEIAPRVFTFPVKRDLGIGSTDNVVKHMTWKFKVGDLVPGWALKAEIEIIARSLNKLAIQHWNGRFDEIILPRPGCGAGELDWECDVKPLCREYEDWLSVISLR